MSLPVCPLLQHRAQVVQQVVRLTPESHHSAEAVNGQALSRQATVLKFLLYALWFL